MSRAVSHSPSTADENKSARRGDGDRDMLRFLQPPTVDNPLVSTNDGCLQGIIFNTLKLEQKCYSFPIYIYDSIAFAVESRSSVISQMQIHVLTISRMLK